MNNQRLILWHWEALYPYDLIAKGLSSLKLPEEFPQDRVYIALPHDYLVTALGTFKDSKFHFGSSDMLDAAPGKFTSSIAATFLAESRANFVIIGKAFDRNQIQETFTSINHKIRAALKENITPFFCFGETREEFEDGHGEEIIKKQISECLNSFSPEEIKHIYFVYDTPGTLKAISDVNVKDLNKTYEIAQRQYISLWGNEIAQHIKTVCALEPFKPLPKDFFENSPFAGFYFKMLDANLSFFCDAAKEIAPFFEKISNHLEPTANEAAKPSTEPVQEKQKEPDKVESPTEESSSDTLSTSSVPALAPTQVLAVHTDLSVHTLIEKQPSESVIPPPQPTEESEKVE